MRSKTNFFVRQKSEFLFYARTDEQSLEWSKIFQRLHVDVVVVAVAVVDAVVVVAMRRCSTEK